eukprot:6332545-Prymnesium_polylepis.1
MFEHVESPEASPVTARKGSRALVSRPLRGGIRWWQTRPLRGGIRWWQTPPPNPSWPPSDELTELAVGDLD